MQPAKEAGPRKTWDVLPPVEGRVSTEVPGEGETRDKGPSCEGGITAAVRLSEHLNI